MKTLFSTIVLLFSISSTEASANWIGDIFFGGGVGQYQGPCPPPRPPILDNPGIPFSDPAREAARQEYMNAVITCRTAPPPTPQEACDAGPKPSMGPECSLYCRICEGGSGLVNGPFTDDPDIDPAQQAGNNITAIGGYVSGAITTVNTAINTLNQMCLGTPAMPTRPDCFGGPIGQGLQCLLGVQASLQSLANVANSASGSQGVERLADAACNVNSALSSCLSAMGPGLTGGAWAASASMGAACFAGRLGNKKIKCGAWERACHDSLWYGQPLLPDRPGSGGYSAPNAGSCDANDPLTDTLPQCGGTGK